MPPFQLVLAIHNHQPVGNFEHVFEQAYDRCYRPFVDLLAEQPAVRVALHYSGPLLEWFERERPALLGDVRRLVDRGQVEILSGGFYEPMLAVLPDRDAQGQITRMQEFCETHWGRRPRGMWLAERVWDPDLPRVIAPTGIRFTLLDDSHFFAAGLPAQRLWGYHVTEKSGAPLAIFPIDKELRYAIPFKTIDALTSDWEQLAREMPPGAAERCLTYGDDGEKFGIWPETYDWVYGKGWLKDFCKLLTDRPDLVRTVHPSEVLQSTSSSGQVYLPTASYEEMGEWAMPPASMHRYEELKQRLKDQGVYQNYEPFVRGGIWQGFLAKYPESNSLHKQTLQISRRLATAEQHGLGSRLGTARTELYRSQCNCAYWHGMFGGLYLNNLRHALSEAALRAQVALDEVEEGGKDFLRAEVGDFDADLNDEISVQTRALSVLMHPALGGALSELAYLPKAYQLSDVLSRREEGYHDKLRQLEAQGGAAQHHGEGLANPHEVSQSKERNLSRFLVFDDYRRLSFLDRFYDPGFALEQLRSGRDGDLAEISRSPYRVERPVAGRTASEVSSLEITLLADGTLRRPERPPHPIRLEKQFHFAKVGATLGVRYRITNAGELPLETVFAVELNLTLLAGNVPDRYFQIGDRRFPMNHRGVSPLLSQLSLVEEWAGFALRLRGGAPFELWNYPVETISQSESGFERTYQGSCLLLRSPLRLDPGATADLRFDLDFASLTR